MNNKIEYIMEATYIFMRRTYSWKFSSVSNCEQNDTSIDSIVNEKADERGRERESVRRKLNAEWEDFFALKSWNFLWAFLKFFDKDTKSLKLNCQFYLLRILNYM